LIVEPRTFWDQFVEPAIVDWCHYEGDVRRATIVICELDNFAEHMLLFLNPALSGRGMMGGARKELCDRVPMLGIVRDIHDTHKHGRLSRKATIVAPPDVEKMWDLFPPLGSLPSTELWIKDAAGKRYELSAIIWECRDYWRAELVRNGLLGQQI